MNHDFRGDPRRHDKAALVELLQNEGATKFRNQSGPGNASCTCPFHDDKNPSASIYERGGVWRFKCQVCGVGGDIYDIEAHIRGLSNTQHLRETLASERQEGAPRPVSTPKSSKSPQAIEPPKPEDIHALEDIRKVYRNRQAEYLYINPATEKPDMIAYRLPRADGGKEFRLIGAACGGFTYKAPPKPWPLYNRVGLENSDQGTVLVVEGEKCVDTCTRIGILATTSAGGAKNAESADWSPLRGRNVVLWPDNDEPGQAYMDTVTKLLQALDPAPKIWRVDLNGLSLGQGGDVHDYVSDLLVDLVPRQAQASVSGIMAEAIPVGPLGELIAHYELIFSGKFQTEELAWPQLSRLSKFLYPGTVALICGDAGSHKSLWVNECCLHWIVERNLKISILHLEEDRTFHMKRALAQLFGQADAFDEEWARANQHIIRTALKKYGPVLQSFGSVIRDAPDRPPHCLEIAKWIEQEFEQGARIIVVDPISLAETSERPWADHQDLMMRAKAAARKAWGTVVFVTHPREGTKAGAGLDNLAGGRAFSRAAACILWLTQKDAGPDPILVPGMGNLITTQPMETNLHIRIIKTRNGRGARYTLGYRFEGHRLTFTELGVIDKAKKRKELEDNTDTNSAHGQIDDSMLQQEQPPAVPAQARLL